MRSSTYLVFFASSIAAQSTVTLFNFFPYQSTLTQIGSDAAATTYKNDCAADKTGFPLLPSSLRPTPNSPSAAITPAPTPRARVVRQASASADGSELEFCEPYTLIQGASTYSIHLEDLSPGAWTVDLNCKWQGAITAAELTCTGASNGYVVSEESRGTSTTVFSKGELNTMEVFSPFTIVTSASAASASTSASASASRAAASTRSTGVAPAGPLPTGAMALVGGAAGVFAAALAL